MEFMDVVKGRHSIRAFDPRPVPEEVLEDLVSAAVLAPTASNLQAWRFFVLTDPALVHKVDLVSPGLSGNPPVIIAIASDMDEADRRGSENSRIYGCMMDASLAAENLMLRAVDLGLGTCAIKSYNDAAVRKLLHLPGFMRLELLISVGYPAGEARAPKRKDMSEVLFWNEYKG